MIIQNHYSSIPVPPMLLQSLLHIQLTFSSLKTAWKTSVQVLDGFSVLVDGPITLSLTFTFTPPQSNTLVHGQCCQNWTRLSLRTAHQHQTPTLFAFLSWSTLLAPIPEDLSIGTLNTTVSQSGADASESPKFCLKCNWFLGDPVYWLRIQEWVGWGELAPECVLNLGLV